MKLNSENETELLLKHHLRREELVRFEAVPVPPSAGKPLGKDTFPASRVSCLEVTWRQR